MHIGSIACASLAIIFGILAITFTILKEKGANLISGFNSYSKEKRQEYDVLKMSIDQRNSFFIWTGIFTVGAILAYLLNEYISIAAFVVWLVLFFKDVHMDRIQTKHLTNTKLNNSFIKKQTENGLFLLFTLFNISLL